MSAAGHVGNGGANPISGYSVIEAESYKVACAHVAQNPMVLDGGGSVEVTQVVEM